MSKSFLYHLLRLSVHWQTCKICSFIGISLEFLRCQCWTTQLSSCSLGWVVQIATGLSKILRSTFSNSQLKHQTTWLTEEHICNWFQSDTRRFYIIELASLECQNEIRLYLTCWISSFYCEQLMSNTYFILKRKNNLLLVKKL